MVAKLKVVFVIGQLGVGGGERQLYLLLKGIDRTKFQPVVISWNPGKNDYWEEPIRKLNVPLYYVEHSRLKILRIWRMFKLFNSINPQVIISWTLHLNFFTAVFGRLLGVPLVIGSIRNDLFNSEKKDRPIHRWFGTKGPHRFVANSTKGKMDMVNRLQIPVDKVMVIFNAVSFDPSALNIVQSREEIRKHFNLPPDQFLLVYVGRIEASKNPIMLVNVLKRVLEKVPGAAAVFIGEGPLKEKVMDVAREYGISSSVYFLGKVPMVVKYLHAFDVFCHTGVADGMPNVLLEASAKSLPIVTTRVNGSDDIVIENVSGFIVSYNDDKTFASRVLTLANSPELRNAFGNSGHNQVLSAKFSEKNMVAKFEELLIAEER